LIHIKRWAHDPCICSNMNDPSEKEMVERCEGCIQMKKSARRTAPSSLIPCDGSTPERVVVKEAVNIDFFVLVNEGFKLVVVEDNDPRNSVGVT